MAMNKIFEPAKEIPIVDDVDICVIGGGCTGVFAAVRAARLGARVAIIEKQNSFGGVATNGMVNYWHSLFDTEHKKQIIAGLNQEVIERLKKRSAVIDLEKKLGKNDPNAYKLNTEELKIELDELIKESGVRPYLHTSYVENYVEDELKAIIIENKSGRQAIKAKVFIDASGDGDLCFRLGEPSYKMKNIQPPTTCAKYVGFNTLRAFKLGEAINKHRDEFNLKEDWGWSTIIPNVEGAELHADTHVFDRYCANADDLTFAEMEGRRQVRAIMDIIRKYGPQNSQIALIALASCIGVRETRHIEGQYRITDEELLNGSSYEDAIANGSYRVDIHHSDGPGITFRYLDGWEEVIDRIGEQKTLGRWRPFSENNPTFYQIPYRSLLPTKHQNVLIAGRMIDAEEGAFGAVRVMVNLNQIGEAAGVAAFLSLDSGKKATEIDVKKLRQLLKAGGSIVI